MHVRTSSSILAALTCALSIPAGAIAATGDAMPKPAIEIKAKNLGKVIATPAKLGIYYWDVEKKAGGKIKCTGSCLKQWPPVYVKGHRGQARRRA